MFFHRRLAISRLRVPNLDGFVDTTAGNLLSIGAPRHRPDPEITRSHQTNQQKQRGKYLKKNLPVRVACQSRLAISRLRVPNLDGCVIATAGNLLSIGTPRHRVDTVFVRSQYTNPQKPGGKTWGKNLLARVPGHQALKNENVHFEIFYIISFSSMYLSTKSYLFECFAQNAGNIFLLFSLAYPYKKRTLLSGRSPSTRSVKKKYKKNQKKKLPVRVPSQRRVAMASGNVPDFDGSVVAAASDKFAVRRKSDGVDTVIETSEHMKHTGTSKDNQKKNLLFRVPSPCRQQRCPLILGVENK